MSPPQLSADAPVAFFGEPVDIRFGVSLREEANSPIFHRIDGVLSQGVHFHEPLIAEKRLNRCLRAVAVLHRNDAVFDFLEVTERFHLRHDLLASLKPIQPSVLAAVLVDRAVGVQDTDRLAHLVLVASPAGVVVRVVSRSHFDGSRAQRFVSQQSVGYDRNDAAVRRNHHMLADEICVTFVGGMNANRRITQHGFRTSR